MREQPIGMTLPEMVRWCHNPDCGSIEQFEDINDWFYSETGNLRPGKSDVRGIPDEVRRQSWDLWLLEKQRAYHNGLLSLRAELTRVKAELVYAKADVATLKACDADALTHANERIAKLEAERDAALADRDVLATLFYEAQESLCSCNIVDTSKPVGDPYNYVCEWHALHQKHVIAREPLITMSQKLDMTERELAAANQRADDAVAALAAIDSQDCIHGKSDGEDCDDCAAIRQPKEGGDAGS